MPWSDESDQGITANCQLPPGQRNNYLAAAEEAGIEAAADGAASAAEEAGAEACLEQATAIMAIEAAATIFRAVFIFETIL